MSVEDYESHIATLWTSIGDLGQRIVHLEATVELLKSKMLPSEPVSSESTASLPSIPVPLNMRVQIRQEHALKVGIQRLHIKGTVMSSDHEAKLHTIAWDDEPGVTRLYPFDYLMLAD